MCSIEILILFGEFEEDVECIKWTSCVKFWEGHGLIEWSRKGNKGIHIY